MTSNSSLFDSLMSSYVKSIQVANGAPMLIIEAGNASLSPTLFISLLYLLLLFLIIFSTLAILPNILTILYYFILPIMCFRTISQRDWLALVRREEVFTTWRKLEQVQPMSSSRDVTGKNSIMTLLVGSSFICLFRTFISQVILWYFVSSLWCEQCVYAKIILFLFNESSNPFIWHLYLMFWVLFLPFLL